MKLNSLFDSLNEFYPYSKKILEFDQDASFNFISDSENAQKLLGKTAYYDPNEYSVTIYVDNRHPKDIMRSVSHELVHHAQNCRGDLSNVSTVGEEGYAQKDSHLREMEREAYEKGNMIFRDWEDGVKSKNNNADTIYERVVKNWGYKVFEQSDTKYQKTVKLKHNIRKARINKTGANKTKAAPFDKGSSSKRAKSAPPGASLEENGEIIIMNKMIEEVVKNVLRNLKIKEGQKWKEGDDEDLYPGFDPKKAKFKPLPSAGGDKEKKKDQYLQKLMKLVRKEEVSEEIVKNVFNGENKIMDTKVIEEVVKNVLKRLRLEAEKSDKDYDGDGEVESSKEEWKGSRDKAIKQSMKEETAENEEQEVSEDDNMEEGSGDRNDPDREQGHGEQRQRASSSASGGKLEEFGDDCEEDEDNKNALGVAVRESKKSLKNKFKKARRENDKREMRRIKQHLGETKTLKEDLVRRKSNLNERLMKRWFNNKK